MMVSGAGCPILLLHAFPLSGRMWDELAPALARHFRPIVADLPGFGAAPSLGDTATMDDMADAVVAGLDRAGVSEPVVPVGVSMGGYVAMRLMARHPDRVRAAALVSTRAAADTPPARENRARNIELVLAQGPAALADKMLPALFSASALATRPELATRFRAMAEAAPAPALVAALRGMAERGDSSGVLRAFSKPVLFVAGGADAVVPAVEMEQLAGLSPKFEFRLVPGAGHLLPLEAPGVFLDLFSAFLKRRVL